MRLLIDENFNHRILRGLLIRLPALEHVVAQDVGLKGISDPLLLEWAAEHSCLLITHDVNTIPKYAYERITAGQPMAGVIVVPENLPIGEAIEELLTIVECSEQSEFENQVLHIPL
jgi:predicted nuclease of predicted toxin-antitoxin system